MILLVDLGYRPDSLPRDEFVNPVARIWKQRGCPGIRALFRDGGRGKVGYLRIILCGTALKDNGFLEHPGRFTWLLGSTVPVLGICAGMQALCLAFGGTVREGCEIGMTNIRIPKPDPIFPDRGSFQVYELHSRVCDPRPAG